MTSRVLDPVCGMSVDRQTAFVGEYRGQSYYFCANGCRAEFSAEPERFLSL
ncbi:MAG: YHS domain-containing protein [Thermoleophilia bacterium]|nr:YHS domain-containing protein [Thermoleophilia bacterium]